jgi:TetR/AcrR family transcriptional regulator, fatty acid metabolism regulator protein
MRTKAGNKEQDIIDASIAVFSEEGYNEAKMHHIAEKAGIGIGTVYLYFRNKERILLRVFEIVWNDLYSIVSGIKMRGDLDPMEKMDRLIDSVFGYFAKYPKLSMVLITQQRNVMQLYKESPLHEVYSKALSESEAIIAEGQKTGVFNPSISPHFYQYFFFGGIRNSLLQWAGEPEAISLQELRANIKTVLLAGITAHKTDPD